MCLSPTFPQPPIHAESLAPAFCPFYKIRRNDSLGPAANQSEPSPSGLAPTDPHFLRLRRHCFLMKPDFSVSKTRKNEREALRKFLGSQVSITKQHFD